jgi:hypothetical protein
MLDLGNLMPTAYSYENNLNHPFGTALMHKHIVELPRNSHVKQSSVDKFIECQGYASALSWRSHRLH